MMLPIGLSIILQMEKEFSENETRNFSVSLMLGIAYAASIGGAATLVGTPPNLALQRIFEVSFPTGPGISFGLWFVMALPLTLIMLAIIWVVLTKLFFRSAAHLKVDQTIVDLRLGYTVLCRQVGSSQWGSCCYPRHLTLDAVVGARYWNLEQELSSTSVMNEAPVSFSSDESWWDPYVGARFRWQFAKRWGLSLYGDVGGFGIEDASDLVDDLAAALDTI
jgi:hypothetical protein